MVSLNIVSHPDDDLLFLNPDILEDDEAYILYMTYGDDGDSEIWSKKVDASQYAYNNSEILDWEGIRSNSLRSGDPYGDLYRMWNDRTTPLVTYFGDEKRSGNGTIVAIKQYIHHYAPDVIRTHDPDVEPAILEGGETLDHIDHIYTAKFVQEAAKAFPLIPVYAYMGYPIRHQPENVSPELAAKKLQMWRKYQEIDTEVAGEQWDLAMSRCYKRRIQ